MNFDEAKIAHDSYVFNGFNSEPLYLLLNQFMKSGNKALQEHFLNFINFQPQAKKSVDKFREVYDFCTKNNLCETIVKFVQNNLDLSFWYNEQETTNQLSELIRVKLVQDEFSPSSSIDKQLFSRVQKSTSIDDIDSIVADMNRLMTQKIYWTYYNTQTTRIMEDIFNKHPRVLPTLVDIKGVDFFIDMIPLDLKITRIPKGFDENFEKAQLIQWLYENQSEQRFGAENRLFLVLNDKNNPANTDRLKVTHYNTIKSVINDYLDKFNLSKLLDINFSFLGTNYSVKSDIIFINIG